MVEMLNIGEVHVGFDRRNRENGNQSQLLPQTQYEVEGNYAMGENSMDDYNGDGGAPGG